MTRSAAVARRLDLRHGSLSGGWTWNPAHRMLSNVTSRPSAGQSPGVQSGGLGLPRSTPMNSSPGSDTGAAEEGDSISAIAAPGADGRTAPVATAFPPAAAGEPDAVPLAGDLPAERHRLPARVTRYWRWRAFYSSLPLLVLLISVAIVLPWGPWWVRWGIVGVVVAVIAAVPHHPAADPLPGLLVRDLVDGDRHPRRDHLHHSAASCRCIACRPCSPNADRWPTTTG